MSVPAMRRVLGDTLRRLGVNEDSVADILLAASEACTNVVMHAGGSVAEYEVAATVDTAGCRVEIIDAGDGWSPVPDGAVLGAALAGGAPPGGAPMAVGVPAAVGALADGAPRRPPPLAAEAGVLAESGRGFEVMRACVDDVTLSTAPGRGTIVTLDKRIRWDWARAEARPRAAGVRRGQRRKQSAPPDQAA